MQFLRPVQRIVVKIGTNSVSTESGVLFSERITAISRQCRLLAERGIQPLIVSSGAVGLGVAQLALSERPGDLASLQACAAIGQSRLMQAWQSALEVENLAAAQILLTREDVTARKRHLALRDSIERCLHLGAVPVVNENDSISADEIKFGDNDVLSAMVASLIKADLLIILTTIDGLYEKPCGGNLIERVSKITPEIRKMAAGPESSRSRGGMITKLDAAEIATRSGCTVLIAKAGFPDTLLKAVEGTSRGTWFDPQSSAMPARKRWIAFFRQPAGRLFLDEGAAKAIRIDHRSLLSVGIRSLAGTFSAGDVVELIDPSGNPIARGVIEFSASQLPSILGMAPEAVRTLFPDKQRLEVVHRDSLVLLE